LSPFRTAARTDIWPSTIAGSTGGCAAGSSHSAMVTLGRRSMAASAWRCGRHLFRFVRHLPARRHGAAHGAGL